MRMRFKDVTSRMEVAGGCLKTAHSDVPLIILHHAAFDEASDEFGLDHDCLGESDVEEALPSDSHTIANATKQRQNTISLNQEWCKRKSEDS